jgi:Cu-Zn family superoxide dismutase
MRTTLAFVLAAAAFAAAGCKHHESSASTTPPPGMSTGGSAGTGSNAAEPAGSGSGSASGAAEMTVKPKRAVANLTGTKGHEKVTGTIEFVEKDGGVLVTAHVEGLTPGDHGFHIHEKGDCSAPDGASAGGHFNPSSHKHGAPDAAEHHEGDLGNLTADKDGKADKTMTLTDVSLGDGANSVVGKGFIVHEKKDDLTTQPTGNAGARVACGVITAQP